MYHWGFAVREIRNPYLNIEIRNKFDEFGIGEVYSIRWWFLVIVIINDRSFINRLLFIISLFQITSFMMWDF